MKDDILAQKGPSLIAKQSVNNARSNSFAITSNVPLNELADNEGSTLQSGSRLERMFVDVFTTTSAKSGLLTTTTGCSEAEVTTGSDSARLGSVRKIGDGDAATERAVCVIDRSEAGSEDIVEERGEATLVSEDDDTEREERGGTRSSTHTEIKLGQKRRLNST